MQASTPRGVGTPVRTAAPCQRRDRPSSPASDVSPLPGSGGAGASRSWYIDETYVKVAGRWCYLYRAIDRDGQLIDSMLSKQRDKHAARRFLRRLVEVAEGRPLRVTTDHHPRLPARDPLDPRAARSAPAPALPEQLHGARPSRREAALLPDARLRELRVRRALLLGVRRTAAVLPLAPRATRLHASRRAAAALRVAVALTALGACCGVGQATTGNRFVGASGGLSSDRDDESAGIRRLVDGRVGCEVGARTRSDPSSDWRFGCLSCDLSAEPEHRLARTGRANVTS